MSSPGRIIYDAMQEYYTEHGEGALKNKCDWDVHPTQLAKNAYEYAARVLLLAEYDDISKILGGKWKEVEGKDVIK